MLLLASPRRQAWIRGSIQRSQYERLVSTLRRRKEAAALMIQRNARGLIQRVRMRRKIERMMKMMNKPRARPVSSNVI